MVSTNFFTKYTFAINVLQLYINFKLIPNFTDTVVIAESHESVNEISDTYI